MCGAVLSNCLLGAHGLGQLADDELAMPADAAVDLDDVCFAGMTNADAMRHAAL